MSSAKTRSVEVKLSTGGFPRSMAFNRFGVQQEGDVRLLQFAFLTQGREMSRFACTVHKNVVERHKDSILSYYESMAEVVEDDASKYAIVPEGEIPVIDALAMAKMGSEAEIAMGNIPFSTAFRDVPKVGGVCADPVIFLRCSVNLQKAFISELYAIAP